MDSKLATDIQSQTSKKDFNDLPQIKTGMQVEVHQRITEGDKSRVQVFKGLVIRTGGKTAGEKTIVITLVMPV